MFFLELIDPQPFDITFGETPMGADMMAWYEGTCSDLWHKYKVGEVYQFRDLGLSITVKSVKAVEINGDWFWMVEPYPCLTGSIDHNHPVKLQS